MSHFLKILFKVLTPCVLVFIFLIASCKSNDEQNTHIWEMQEIVLEASNEYQNYYTDVTCWVDLTGPNFSKRVYGFWDGNNVYKVKIVATVPGDWTWKSGSNQTNDSGLNDQTGEFKAVVWTEEELLENPNRRGFVRATINGHALQYSDGTPFFIVGDTWLAGTTWRLPFRNTQTSEDYIPAPGISFEDAVQYRKKQGFNSVSMIASFPNWEADGNANTYADSNGIYVRNAWEKFGYPVDSVNVTSKDMRDEYGNKPFEMSQEHEGVADYNHIIPAYFQSLDKKMQYLSDQGFVPLIETVRRDMGPTWKAYFDFNDTYARYVQYLISRYGAYNILFSGIHLDWIPELYSLTADEFNEVLTYHLNKYGPLPFGQMHTTLINNSTFRQFGHAENCPWLTMHSVGNKPRDHRVSGALDTLFHLEPAYPAINFEPYYTGWNHSINMPGGERPPANSPRDNYFSRAQMYGSVLSGGLSGHVHGTAAYDITSTGEPDGMRPHIWDALKYESANYMQIMKAFVLSEGEKYQNLLPAHEDIIPRKAPGSPPDGLDGWAYMMRTAEKDFALLYFENESVLPKLNDFKKNTFYQFLWYNTVTSEWSIPITIETDDSGRLALPGFPLNENSANDWAAKILELN